MVFLFFLMTGNSSVVGTISVDATPRVPESDALAGSRSLWMLCQSPLPHPL